MVAAQVGSGGGQVAVGGFYDRATGRAFAWDGSLLGLHLLDSRMLVFGSLGSDPTYGKDGYAGNTFVAGRFFMTNRDLQPIGEFNLGPDITASSFESALSTDGATLILAGATRFLPFIVDVHRAEVLTVEPPAGATGLTGIRTVAPGPEPGSVEAIYNRTDGAATAVTWAADASLLEQRTIAAEETGGLSLTSPDGLYSLVDGTLRDRAWGIGDQENWVFTELVRQGESRSRFRVLSGWAGYGLGGRRRWLADSSAFLVQGADPDASLDDYLAWRTGRAYYRVDTSGAIEKLPHVPQLLTGSPGDAGSNWAHYAYFGGPEPSPDAPELMVFGRRAVYDSRTGTWFGPGRGPSPYEGDDPWLHGTSEAFFTFPNLGRGYASPGTILPPVVVQPPFSGEVVLAVARAGDCLNLRERPASGAEVLDCMPDGSRLTVADPQYLLDQGWRFQDGPPAFWSDDVEEPRQMYVYVEQDSGQRGWAAIQYLDWAAAGGST
jgi:hypothetical protein